MDMATKIWPVFMHRQGYLAQSPELSRLSSASRESPENPHQLHRNAFFRGIPLSW